jgi:hypothetical protein
MGLLDLIQGFKSHATAPHVSWRIQNQRARLIINCKCGICGDGLHWVCVSPMRARSRVDTWARIHQHGVGR